MIRLLISWLMDKSNEMIPSRAQFNQVIFWETWVPSSKPKTKCEMNATQWNSLLLALKVEKLWDKKGHQPARTNSGPRGIADKKQRHRPAATKGLNSATNLNKLQSKVLWQSPTHGSTRLQHLHLVF